MAMRLWRPSCSRLLSAVVDEAWKYALSGVRMKRGDVGMNDACCGDVTGVVRLLRRHTEWLAGAQLGLLAMACGKTKWPGTVLVSAC